MPVLPDVDAVLLALLRAELPALVFGTQQPADVLARLPYVVVRKVGGTNIDERFAHRSVVNVDAYAADRPTAAALAETVRGGILACWRPGRMTTDGHRICSFRTVSSAVEIRDGDQPDWFARFNAIYAVTVR